MTDTTHLTIKKELLHEASELARSCSSEATRERVLVSRAVALSLREYLRAMLGIESAEGRSGLLKYVELLDVCDFKVGEWSIEVRPTTNIGRAALYVPTVPLMVGVISDFYVAAQVDFSLSHTQILGYATRSELSEAELTANGLFALLSHDQLRPFETLPDELKRDSNFNTNSLRVFDEWRARAERIMRGVQDVLTADGVLLPVQVARLASSLQDEILRIYGEQLPATGLEPLFAQLFRRFGIDRPVPSAPDSAVAFSSETKDRIEFAKAAERDRFFRDDLGVKRRVSLYRYLIEDETALAEHQKTKKTLDLATGGKHQSGKRRREYVRAAREGRAQRAWIEPPVREAHTAKVSDGDKRMTRLEDLQQGAAVKGILPDGLVTVVETKWYGSDVVELIYKDAQGRLGNELLYRDREATISIAERGHPWSFDADGNLLRLASEAYRIRLAYLFDPLLAVHTSLVEPLPHQITAVYGEMLARQPLRFLLADDPGAGKTIMAGLLIKELMIRGDVRRCLIVCPGMLVEQWQDELNRKFNLPFEIMTNDKYESARTGNWFQETPLAICRLDKLSRNEDVQLKLEQTDWDLIVCDEAHKMSASFFGGEIRRTKRYLLGQKLSQQTRHFLLMTATPHNGKEEDFQLFMALLDGDRFEGRFRDGVHVQDTSDLMRRLVKEKLLKFDGTPLFPERLAYTVNYTLSEAEADLYKQVTDYVREEFNRADALENEGRKGTVGFALTILQRRLASSPEAIYQSLKRRRERLEKRLREERLLQRGAEARIEFEELPSVTDEYLEDLEDAPEAEVEQTEERVVDLASAAQTIAELEAEINTLRRLEGLALRVRHGGTDRKWEELRSILQDNPEVVDAEGHRHKLVIFTEHRDTLNYLAEQVRAVLGRRESVVTIHGGMGREDRRKAQESFTQDKETEILIATDAAGEGINLQRAHLMCNYDLPWNPNRLEQRFGRIHRIGQTEVCHLWNIVAGETREGAVFQALCKKLEEESKALRGQIFDVLGKAFTNTPLRHLLVEAIRYGDKPEVRARLMQVVDAALDRDHLKQLIEEQALAQDTMDVARVREIREDMERAEARRLQPHFITEFFLEAFKLLGGQIYQREPKRYEITNVPASIRNRDRQIGRGEPLLQRYQRVTFEKSLIAVPGKPLAAFVSPGHPLLDATIDLVLERYRDLLRCGAVLVDPNDESEKMRALFYLENSIQDARTDEAGNRRVVSRQMQFVEIDPQGGARMAGYAPYLDYRPIAEDEMSLVSPEMEKNFLGRNLEASALDFAVRELVPRHFAEVKERKEKLIDKTVAAVKERLTKEIVHWDSRAEDLKLRELAGQQTKLSSGNARQRADELQRRLQDRMEKLEQERKLSPTPPVVIGGAIVIPVGLLARLKGERRDEMDEFARETARIEQLAMSAVMEIERALGYKPRDVSHEKLGYDIESKVPETGRLRFIEVKGRAAGAKTVTVTKNEILTALNKPDEFILALVEVDGEAATPRYVKRPFQREPDFHVTSINYDFDELRDKAEEPA